MSLLVIHKIAWLVMLNKSGKTKNTKSSIVLVIVTSLGRNSIQCVFGVFILSPSPIFNRNSLQSFPSTLTFLVNLWIIMFFHDSDCEGRIFITWYTVFPLSFIGRICLKSPRKIILTPPKGSLLPWIFFRSLSAKFITSHDEALTSSQIINFTVFKWFIFSYYQKLIYLIEIKIYKIFINPCSVIKEN